jgi:ATP-dependent DNA ligase
VAVASHFIEPCLPSPGEQPPTGPGWVHEIKHDGYRLMARRDALSVGIRLLTRNGHDWGAFALLDPLLARPALVVESNDALGRGLMFVTMKPTRR